MELKHHLIIIGLFGLIVYFMYNAKDIQETVKGKQKGDGEIEVIEASYGQNCNKFIRNGVNVLNRGKKQRMRQIQPGNANDLFAKRCNGQFTCAFTNSPADIGMDPMQGCRKFIKISYKCSDVEFPITLTIAPAKKAFLDCTKEARNNRSSDGMDASGNPMIEEAPADLYDEY